LTESSAEVFGPVAADLASLEALLRKSIDQDPPEVGSPMGDLFEAGGKRIRPALVLLSAKCGTYDTRRLFPAAMAVEVTHAATLVHDDVIDRSATRRGRPTVAAKLGDEPAIVVGDFYFAKAYELAAQTDSPEVVAVLARAVKSICVGEVRQQSIRYRYGTDVDEYMERISAKTGVLLGACCEIGALLSGLDGDKREALVAYGLNLGLAFQIADDVLDYLGTEGEVGKPIGHDIREGFATLPFMLAEIQIEDGRRLDEAEARRVAEEVRARRGADAALEQARNFARLAREKLTSLPECEATSTLASLTEYVVSRKL
jgi:heptaprenyl diphosphate synthase